MTETIRIGRRLIEITHGDRVMFPNGTTKRELAEYYAQVSEAMFPEARDRLLTLERFPEGIEGERFYQKSVSKYFPEWIGRRTVPKKGGEVTHPVAKDRASFVYLAQQSCITPHMSLSRVDKIDHPDQLIFDLDPSVDRFSEVRSAALDLRGLLEDLGLFVVVKTTGSRGLHLTVPLDRSATFDHVREFARGVAEVMVGRSPKRLTMEHLKTERGERIFLDWMRNARAATAVVPYGVRARPSAPVAMPIHWEEVSDRSLKPGRYTITSAVSALAEGHDPWKGWRRRARSLREPRKRLDDHLAS